MYMMMMMIDEWRRGFVPRQVRVRVNFGPSAECFYMPGEPALLCEMREREVEGPRSKPGEFFLYFACTVRVGLWFVAPGGPGEAS